MSHWKLAASYWMPALIFASLLCGHFLSQLGLLEQWFLGDTEIRQTVSFPPASAPSRAGIQEEAAGSTSRQWSNDASDQMEIKEFDDSKGNDDRFFYANASGDSTKTALRTARAYFNQALANTRSGRLDEAIGSYRQALVHNRDFPHALLNLGTLHYRRQEWQKAREAFEAATRLNGSYAKAHFNLALTYGKLGELDKAVRAARRALALDTKNAATYNLLGLMHTLQGDYESAVSVYKQGLAVDAKDGEVLSNLSLAYLKMNRTTRAEENL
jgi:tetratricopeptide (TPR) repeat protein